MALYRLRNSIGLYLLAACLLLTFRPYFTWTNALPAIGAMVLFIGLIVLGKKHRVDKKKLFVLPLLFVICLYSVLTFTVSGLLSLIIIGFFLLDDQMRIKVIDKFRNLYAVLLIVSIIIFIIVVWLGVDIPYSDLEPANKNKEITYKLYPFLVVYNNPRLPFQLFRFCFIFDEPGVVGTVAAMLLMTYKYKLNKWQNIIIALSGVLSFSTFFFVISFVFILFYHFRYIFNIKFLIAVFGIGLIFATYESDVFDFETLVFHGVERGNNGKIVGDNRSDDAFDKVYKQFWDDGLATVLLGKGQDAHSKIAPGIQSYKMIVYDNGVIYMLLSLAFYLIYSLNVFRRVNKDFIMYMLFILAFYYQRPAYLFQYGEFYILTLIPFSWRSFLSTMPPSCKSTVA